MSATLAAGVSGHRGLLAVIIGSAARQITGPEGASINWGYQTDKYGGFGHSSKRSVLVMPSGVEIEVKDKVWDPTDVVVMGMANAMLNGTSYTFYHYPIGQTDKTIYTYGDFCIIPEFEQTVEEVIREPFTMENTGEVYRVGM